MVEHHCGVTDHPAIECAARDEWWAALAPVPFEQALRGELMEATTRGEPTMNTATLPEGVTVKEVPVDALDRVTRGQMGDAKRALSLVVDGTWSIIVPRPEPYYATVDSPAPDARLGAVMEDHLRANGWERVREAWCKGPYRLTFWDAAKKQVADEADAVVGGRA